MNYWLAKSEPGCFSIDDLKRDKVTAWDGVRNYQARNFIRAMQPGDLLLFYHSNCNPPGIAGIGKIISSAYPDKTAEKPTLWSAVDVEFVEKFKELMPLPRLKACPELAAMQLLKTGNRLSVMPVSSTEWDFINNLAHSGGYR